LFRFVATTVTGAVERELAEPAAMAAKAATAETAAIADERLTWT
jgi:hypothetical protein